MLLALIRAPQSEHPPATPVQKVIHQPFHLSREAVCSGLAPSIHNTGESGPPHNAQTHTLLHTHTMVVPAIQIGGGLPVSKDHSGVCGSRHRAGSFCALHIQQPHCALTRTPPQPYPPAVPLCNQHPCHQRLHRAQIRPHTTSPEAWQKTHLPIWPDSSSCWQ